MKLVTLEQTKKHLVIDSEYKADDEYLRDLIEEAAQIVCAETNRTLAELEAGDAAVRVMARRAILLKVGDLYRFREATDTTALKTTPAYSSCIAALTIYYKAI